MRLLFFFIFFIISCTSFKIDQNSVATFQESLPIPADSGTVYFPIDSTVSEPTRGQSFVKKWYSEMLFALHEPVLYKYSGEGEIYRFTWLRTFHNPVTIRVQKQGDNITLYAKVTNGAGGYEPGQIKMDTAFGISENQWEKLKAQIARAGFWSQPTNVKINGMDGAQWILEGVSNKQYHWVDRWTPTRGEIKEICDYLLTLSKVPINSKDYY